MKVAVEVYAIAARTYIVEVPDGLAGIPLHVAVQDAHTRTWERVEDWDEDPDWDDNMEPVAIYSLTKDGDIHEALWGGDHEEPAKDSGAGTRFG